MPIANVTLGDAWGWLLAGAAAIVALAKAWEIVSKLAHPAQRLEATMEDIQAKLDRDNARIRSLEESQKETEKGVGVLLRSMMALINHELSGNDVDHLRTVRDEIQDYLTNR